MERPDYSCSEECHDVECAIVGRHKCHEKRCGEYPGLFKEYTPIHWVEKPYCESCFAFHVERKVCLRCGICLYANARQDLVAVNEGFPIVICTGCGRPEWWD